MNPLPAEPLIPTALGQPAQAVGPVSLEGLPPLSEPEARAWAVLQRVLDPEVPALSVCDLGIVRGVRHESDSTQVTVELTPTYSGCPATEAIELSVRQALEAAGFTPVRTERRRAPAWSTDWITPEGRAKLKAYGIAPPAHLQSEAAGAVPIRIVRRQAVACPRCESPHTERLSAFGATACKALYRCLACREPFEHFKPL